MDFYKSGSYLSPYTEYPIQMGLNEYVYVQYSVESGADLVIMAENCRATKFGAFYSWPYYNLIQNGYVQAAERLVVCVKVDNYSGEKKIRNFYQESHSVMTFWTSWDSLPRGEKRKKGTKRKKEAVRTSLFKSADVRIPINRIFFQNMPEPVGPLSKGNT